MGSSHVLTGRYLENYPIQAPHSEDEKQGHRDAKESSWDGVGGGRKVQRGGDIFILMADSCCCMAETNTIL